jgi:hypothetical protein
MLRLGSQARGFQTFTFEFHVPFYVIKESKRLLSDTRKGFEGKPLRRSWALPFLSGSRDAPCCLYEAQMSVTVTGIDDYVWTAYGIVDSYFQSKDTAVSYHKMQSSRTLWIDPLAAGQLPFLNPVYTPREYYLKVFEIRMRQVLREWQLILDKIEEDATLYVFHLGFSLSNFVAAKSDQASKSQCSPNLPYKQSLF